MQIFYDPDISTNGGFLNEEEAKHCVKVLRHKPGDKIFVIDGKGSRFHCEIAETSSKTCRLTILDTEKAPAVEGKCHIAIAPTKSNDRFEWFLEKSTEIGIDKITPLLCKQSERKRIKIPRLERVLTAATKQSLRLWKPDITELTDIKDFLNSDHQEKYKFIAHCEGKDRKELFNELQKRDNHEDVLILIGPEGDFTKEEIETALSKGFQPVSLGKNRLRTETAGIAACMAIQLTSSYYK
ncbi:16S rRNA (uracil(1498)-N(3))-methyltransferase [Marinilabilia rubra]|uniref:Ribosomal RNA small subunit methyltransferase E n=1 Tax=Marinilabilia rubra TaxID=2162893 RepID=A0A2U2B3J1_9BACT|nr:16S rRNA (uracil(1498)-N(3))-methyltransferase [Marinilabilia rubra]PWD97633.1 16S rRNA (uracil(1498)-N(3))-methyltransferase [Marinilabilia rubra]